MTKLIPSPLLFPDFDPALDAFFYSSMWGDSWGREGSPSARRLPLPYRVVSEGDEAIAEVEVPGVEPSDIKVKIDGKAIGVETPRGNAYITLGQRLKSEEATATIKNGILLIKVPRREAKVVEVTVQES